MKNSFFETNKHGFQENKHYFFKEKTSFLYIFVYCPESLLKVCCKLSVKLSGGVASLTETFNANFARRVAEALGGTAGSHVAKHTALQAHH